MNKEMADKMVAAARVAMEDQWLILDNSASAKLMRFAFTCTVANVEEEERKKLRDADPKNWGNIKGNWSNATAVARHLLAGNSIKAPIKTIRRRTWTLNGDEVECIDRNHVTSIIRGEINATVFAIFKQWRLTKS